WRRTSIEEVNLVTRSTFVVVSFNNDKFWREIFRKDRLIKAYDILPCFFFFHIKPSSHLSLHHFQRLGVVVKVLVPALRKLLSLDTTLFFSHRNLIIVTLIVGVRNMIECAAR